MNNSNMYKLTKRAICHGRTYRWVDQNYRKAWFSKEIQGKWWVKIA